MPFPCRVQHGIRCETGGVSMSSVGSARGARQQSSTEREPTYLVLKRNQFIGGVLCLAAGLLLVLLGRSDPTKVQLGLANLKLSIISSVGAVVMVFSCLTLWRSGGGVRISKKMGTRGDVVETIVIDPSVARGAGNAAVVCPECAEQIEYDLARLKYTCTACGRSWEQRIPRHWQQE
jgi:hypothetical protein